MRSRSAVAEAVGGQKHSMVGSRDAERRMMMMRDGGAIATGAGGDATRATRIAARRRSGRGRGRARTPSRRGRGGFARAARPAGRRGPRVRGARFFARARAAMARCRVGAHLRGREHAAAAAHVTESTLARAVGTTTGDARDARDGAAGAPGLGRGLVAGHLRDGVRLAVVLVQAGVHRVDDVRADGRQEHLGEGDGTAALDGHGGKGSGGHLRCVFTRGRDARGAERGPPRREARGFYSR